MGPRPDDKRFTSFKSHDYKRLRKFIQIDSLYFDADSSHKILHVRSPYTAILLLAYTESPDNGISHSLHNLPLMPSDELPSSAKKVFNENNN